MFLVGDIGGTNARFGLVVPGEAALQDIRSYKNASFASLEEVITAYLADHPGAMPQQIVVAIAGPVTKNIGRMTNLPWVVDGDALSRRFGGAPTQIVNDLTALGQAALGLTHDQLIALNPVAPPAGPQKQALVVGIGTGFNVSPVIAASSQSQSLSVEAGHASLPGRLVRALDQIEPELSDNFDTFECLFSGVGRRKFLSLRTGKTIDRATPYLEASGKAGNEEFDEAFDLYAHLIGVMLMDMKLAYLPFSGIFLAGGVARSALTGHRAELCRTVFCRQGQFIDTPMPLWIINDDTAALYGCRAIALASLQTASCLAV